MRRRQPIDRDFGEPEGGSFGPRVPLKVGPYATHNNQPFPLLDVTIQARVEEQTDPACLFSHTIITYRFKNTFREAELWFPKGELEGVMSFELSVNGTEARCKTVLQPAPDGLPPHLVMPPQGLPNEDRQAQSKARVVKYNFWKGEQLEDMDVGLVTTVTVEYNFLVPPVDVGVHTWILPLSILPRAPTAFNLRLELLKDITSVTSSNAPKGLEVAIQGRKAAVALKSPENLSLDEHYLVIKINQQHRETPTDPILYIVLGLVAVVSVVFSLLIYVMFNPDILIQLNRSMR